ncbi:MAG: hypothetical protein ACK5O9_03945 [Holosporales bacterium]
MTTKKPTKPTPLKEWWEQNKEDDGGARLSATFNPVSLINFNSFLTNLFGEVLRHNHIDHCTSSIGSSANYQYNVRFIVYFEEDYPWIALEILDVL